MTNIRELTEADYPAIDQCIVDRVWERSNKKWAAMVDPQIVGDAVKNKHPHIHSVIVEETYLLVFAVAHLWFTAKFFIEEKLVLKLYDGPGKFSDVIQALEHTAKVTEASGILVGTSMAPNDKALVRLYEKEGFEFSQAGLYK